MDMKEGMVLLDGVELPAEAVRTMAKNAPCHIAEHYLLQLHTAALKRKDPQAVSKPADVTTQHDATHGSGLPASTGNMPGSSSMDEAVKAKYKNMKEAEKLELLRKAMVILKDETDEKNQPLFSKKQDWMGVFMVLHDRLDPRLHQSHFEEFAIKFTPDDWPEKLKIGKTTMTNFSSVVNNNNSYNVKKNKFDKFCTKFWSIIVKLMS